MDEKKCTKCGKTKLLKELYPRYDRDDKFSSNCKECRLKECRAYQRSIPGLVTEIYSSEKNRYKIHPEIKISYSKEEFRKWLLSQPNFYDLYNEWIDSEYDKFKRPSVDRIDDYKGYSLDNIQLMTWKGNSDKACKDRIEGRNTKYAKAVVQYDLDGKFVEEYYSTAEASRKTGSDQRCIVHLCNNRKGYVTVKGYLWKWKE